MKSRSFDGFKVGIVAACRGPMDFRMVRERAYDEGGTKRGCWTQLMFTYWRHVCRHGAVTRGPQTRAGGFYFPLSPVRMRARARVYTCVSMRIVKRGCVMYMYTGMRACVWRGRRVVKQVAPKPRPWAVAVKYCGCFKNRSNPSRRYFPSSWRTRRGACPISREELVGKYSCSENIHRTKRRIFSLNNLIFGKRIYLLNKNRDKF